MPVDTSERNRNAVLYDCQTTEWAFNAGKDLIIKGTVTKKYFINDTANVFFTVRVTYLNRNDTPILMDRVKTGNERNFSLIGLKIE